MKELIFCLI